MSESDLEVNISCGLSCEPRAALEPTICSRCVWSVRPLHPFAASFPGDCPDMRCVLHRVQYLTDAPVQFALCANINKEGKCPEFKARPAAKPIVAAQVTLWQKIKKLFS